MKSITLKIFPLVGVIVFVAVLWPIFIQGESSLKIGYFAISAAMIGIAALALFSGKRWMMWAALGVWPGAISGGALFAVIALVTIRNDTTGWEGVIAVIIVVMGVFIGGIVGAITGGVLGARRTRRTDSAN